MRQEFNQNPQNIQIHQVSTSTSAMSLNSNPIVSTIIPEGHESSIPGSRLSRRSSHGSFSDGLYSDFSESEGQPKGVPSRLSSPGDNSTTRGRSELRSELLRRHEFRCQSLPGFERVCKTRSHIHPGIESETQFSMCQIAPIPGKGLGTIATRDIRQGILILEETPLATVQNQDFFAADGDEETDNMVKDIVDSVKRLSIQQRYEFLQLYRFFPDSYSEAFKQSPAPYNSDESIDIIAKFLTNSFGDTKHADVLKVLTLKASRLNHSCSPNATWRYNRETNKFQIRANQDIASGSEVTIVYSCLLEPRKDRQAKLERGYGFVCECIACDLHSEYGIATENRRKQIQQLFRRLVRYLLQRRIQKLTHFIGYLQIAS